MEPSQFRKLCDLTRLGFESLALRYLEDEPIKDRTCLLNRVDAQASGEHVLRLPPTGNGQTGWRPVAC